MALISCPFCHKQISDKAESCPHCKKIIGQTESQEVQQEIVTEFLNESKRAEKKNKPFVKILVAIVTVVFVGIILMIFFSNSNKENSNSGDNADRENTTSDLLVELEYGFIDYTEFSEYWFDGVFRCGTDFEAGDYYILPLFGDGAIYEVCDSPDEFSWSYHRLLRKIAVKDGQYVNIAHGEIMVKSEDVDTDNWSKYGVFLVGKDVPAGEYKMETINSEYKTDLYYVQGINGAYQINTGDIESTPSDCSMLFDSQGYITLEEGQYITITNTKLTSVNVSQTLNQEDEPQFSVEAKPVDGQEHQHDDFVYVIYDDDSIEITKYLGNESELDISSEINGYAVSRIGASAFEDCTSIEEINIWADVISIGDSAFKGCSKLKEISVPSSVTIVNDSTFENCKKLEEVNLWGDVVSIGKYAFRNCTSLKEISIPSSCILIEISAFEGCSDMEEVNIWGGGVIEASAFKNCSSLKEISFPSEITDIGESAFENCTSLKEVNVWGDNVTFGVNVFANCPKLEEMPEGAYNDYSRIEEVGSDETDSNTDESQATNKKTITSKNVKSIVEELLENDLNASVKIKKLYYNEELEGCLAEFKSGGTVDTAAIHLDTEKIDYKSEYDYYSEKAKKLRKETPVNENQLHECNQKILNSSYSEWNFAITTMEAEGETSKNGWIKLK